MSSSDILTLALENGSRLCTLLHGRANIYSLDNMVFPSSRNGIIQLPAPIFKPRPQVSVLAVAPDIPLAVHNRWGPGTHHGHHGLPPFSSLLRLPHLASADDGYLFENNQHAEPARYSSVSTVDSWALAPSFNADNTSLDTDEPHHNSPTESPSPTVFHDSHLSTINQPTAHAHPPPRLRRTASPRIRRRKPQFALELPRKSRRTASGPHITRRYSEEQAHFVIYHIVDLQLPWKEVEARFKRWFPTELDRSEGGLQSIFYRCNEAIPCLTPDGLLELDEAMKPKTTKILARDDRVQLVRRYPEEVVRRQYRWVLHEHMCQAKILGSPRPLYSRSTVA